MKNMLKKIGLFVIWAILVAGIIFITGFINKKHEHQLFRAINISVDGPEGISFLTEKDVESELMKLYDTIVGRPVSSINLEKLEMELNRNPYVEKADAHSSINGILNITLIQKNPILRVINQEGLSGYYDMEGMYIPVHRNRAAHVPVAHGYLGGDFPDTIAFNISNNIESTSPFRDYEKVFAVARVIARDAFLQALIDQIYLTHDKKIELVPRIGNQLIVLGDTDMLDSKFRKLKIFYKEGMMKEGWTKYKTINLMYNNQIVCKKY